MTAIAVPTTTSVRPTRVQALILRMATAAGELISTRMARRAARVAQRVSDETLSERRRDAGAVRALGVLPR